MQGWRDLPVSAIANFTPVVISDLDAVTLRKTLAAHPYRPFRVVRDGKPAGMLTRTEAEAALEQSRSPNLHPAITCLREETVATFQMRLIESETHFVLVLDRTGGGVTGLVTLHDLMRAASAMAEKTKEDV